MASKIVVPTFVGCNEMRKYGCNFDCAVVFQYFAQFFQIFFLQPETMHARVDFDMYGIIADAHSERRFYKDFQRFNAVYFRLKTIFNHYIEIVGVGIENDDGHAYARFAQTDTFVGAGNSEIINAMIL